MKIAELINSYDQITKKRTYNLSEKKAFVANPSVPPPQDPAAAQQQAAAPAQGAAPQPAPAAQPPPQDPAAAQQGAAPQAALPPEAAQLDASGDGSLLDELTAAIQQLPPEAQQQLAAALQQVQQLPPDQREAQLFQLLTQLQGGGAPPQDPAAAQQQAAAPTQGAAPQPAPAAQPPPQDPVAAGGMVAQADEYSPDYEQLMAALQQQGAPEDSGGSADGSQEIQQAQSSADQTTNELDNVKVTLSVRELLDLVGKGTATASLLKVKQLADTHQQKMDQSKQKAEAANQKQQQQAQQQSQDQGINSGGIYPSPMTGA